MTLTHLPVGSHIAITKIRVAPNARVAPGLWSDWGPGASHDHLRPRGGVPEGFCETGKIGPGNHAPFA